MNTLRLSGFCSGVADGRQLWKTRRRKLRLGAFLSPVSSLLQVGGLLRLRDEAPMGVRPAAAVRRRGTRSPPPPLPGLGRIAPCSHGWPQGVTFSGALLLTLLASLKPSLCAAHRGHLLYVRVVAVSSWDAENAVANKGEIRGIRAKCDAIGRAGDCGKQGVLERQLLLGAACLCRLKILFQFRRI